MVLVRGVAWSTGAALLMVLAVACGSESAVDTEFDEVSRQSSSGTGRSSGELPRPSRPSGGARDDEEKEQKGTGSDAGAASRDAGNDSAVCELREDEPNWASDIPFDGFLLVEEDELDVTVRLEGHLDDYFDFDVFGIDVLRPASPRLQVAAPVPPEVRLCAFVWCWSGEAEGVTCGAGEDWTHEGIPGCCGTDSVSLDYTGCSGSSEYVSIYPRITADDVDQICVPYAITGTL